MFFNKQLKIFPHCLNLNQKELVAQTIKFRFKFLENVVKHLQLDGFLQHVALRKGREWLKNLPMNLLMDQTKLGLQ